MIKAECILVYLLTSDVWNYQGVIHVRYCLWDKNKCPLYLWLGSRIQGIAKGWISLSSK